MWGSVDRSGYVQGEVPVGVGIPDGRVRVVISQLPASVPTIYHVDGPADLQEVGKLVDQYTGAFSMIVARVPESRAEPYDSGGILD